MSDTAATPTYIFNHDGCDRVRMLIDTDMTEQDAADVLLGPLRNTPVKIVDWCTLSTGVHNVRLPHGKLYWTENLPTERNKGLSQVIHHYAKQPLDLLDIVIKHGHEAGMTILGDNRLNHCALGPETLENCPGRTVQSTTQWGNKTTRKDFTDEAFHAYLEDLFIDLLEKGVDGLSMDFERKEPFFPDGTPQQERFDACTAFVKRIRKLSDQPLLARVSHESKTGEHNGQDPVAWIAAGLLDYVVPATHNHNPDPLDWRFDRFVAAASKSPRPCKVVPQIWPTFRSWGERSGNLHSPEAVLARVREQQTFGSDGAYFFNFCCAEDGKDNSTNIMTTYADMFSQLPATS